MNLYEYINFSSESEIYDYFTFSSGKYAELEEMYGGKLPWEFINFLEWMEKGAYGKNYHGQPCFLYSTNDDTVDELQTLALDKPKYRNQTNIKSIYDILIDWDMDWTKNGFIPFAEDDGGNFYILMKGKVYYIFHEEADDPTLQTNSFSEFVKRTQFKNIYDKLMKVTKLRPDKTVRTNGHDVQILDANKSERLNDRPISCEVLVGIVDGDVNDKIYTTGNSFYRYKKVGNKILQNKNYLGGMTWLPDDTIEDVMKMDLYDWKEWRKTQFK